MAADFIGLLTGSENLYKYCFVGGLGLIILCLFYPLNKRYDLACKKDVHNKQILLLNLDIDELTGDYTKLCSEVSSYDSLKKSKVERDSINRHFAGLVTKRKQIDIKHAEIKYDSCSIITLKENIADITAYEQNFRRAGWTLAIIGFFGWFLLMIKQHKTKQTD